MSNVRPNNKIMETKISDILASVWFMKTEQTFRFRRVKTQHNDYTDT